MTVHAIAENTLLVLVVISCWLGALGMWRMREPIQALQYLSLPATVGAAFLLAAVWLSQGLGQTLLKVALMGVLLLGTNSVVTHATARAFRARELGHWEPLDGDPMEKVTEPVADDPLPREARS